MAKPVRQRAAGKIRAVRTPGGEPLTSVWRIYDEDASQQVALADQKMEATFSLNPGKYRLRAKASNTISNGEVDLPFEIGSGKHHVPELAYNSGIISFETYDFEGGPAVQSVFWIEPNDVRGAAQRWAAWQLTIARRRISSCLQAGTG